MDETSSGVNCFHLALEFDLHDRLALLVDDLEREVLHVCLHLCVLEFAADQALRIEDGVGWVHGDLVLRRVTNQALCVGEGNERGRRPVTLVIGDDLDAVIPKDAHARVGRAQVNSDCWGHGDSVCRLWWIEVVGVKKDSVSSVGVRVQCREVV